MATTSSMPPISCFSSLATASCLLKALRGPIRPPNIPGRLLGVAQCRFLHLYKVATSKVDTGQHTIVPYSRYAVPCLDKVEHKIDLRKRPAGERLREGLSYTELATHVRPGRCVTPTELITKKEWPKLKELDIPETRKSYYIAEIVPKKVQNEDKVLNKTSKEQAPPEDIDLEKARLEGKPVKETAAQSANLLFAGLREVQVTLSSPANYWRHVMGRAYQQIRKGFYIEFSMRVGKAGKNEPGDPEMWPWVNTHFPHMRPDLIKAAMPRGTYFVIDPFSNGKHLKFVLGLPTKEFGARSLTRRVLEKKERIQKSIDAGQQSGLSKRMRKVLIEQGKTDYSLDTAAARNSTTPKVIVLGEAPRGKRSVKIVHEITPRWGESSLTKSEALEQARKAHNKLTSQQRKTFRAGQRELSFRQQGDTIKVERDS